MKLLKRDSELLYFVCACSQVYIFADDRTVYSLECCGLMSVFIRDRDGKIKAEESYSYRPVPGWKTTHTMKRFKLK